MGVCYNRTVLPGEKVRNETETKVKSIGFKSAYIFVCVLLGALLFTLIHRAIFSILYAAAAYDAASWPVSGQLTLLALDKFTLACSMLAGAWYGVWLGLGWFDLVYERGGHLSLMGLSLSAIRSTAVSELPRVRDQVTGLATVMETAVLKPEAVALKPRVPRPVKKPVVRAARREGGAEVRKSR